MVRKKMDVNGEVSGKSNVALGVGIVIAVIILLLLLVLVFIPESTGKPISGGSSHDESAGCS